MRSLNSLVAITALASAMMLAQSQNTPASPQVDRPANQADKPAAQASPSTQTQADRPSTTTGGADSRTWTGTIVNATCSQASNLPGSSSFADRTASSSTSATTASSAGQSSSKAMTGKENSANSTSSDKSNKSVYDLEKEVLKRCPANTGATSFAVLTDDGSFYKLDDAGNSQVMSQAGGSDSDKNKKKIKNMRVTVTGTVQGDSLKVQSLTKTDKPFGGPA
jgi:hypothetical protein